jgi:DNA-binding response OmpR family regulator
MPGVFLQPEGAPRVGGAALPGHEPWAAACALVLETEAEGRTPVKRTLERDGLEVVQSATAAGALRLLYDRRPDVIVLDLSLPDVDGLHLLSRIRDLTDVPVIVVNGASDEMSCVRLLRAGADDFLPAPLGTQELLARVEALLRRTPRKGSRPSRYADSLLEIDYAALEVRAGGQVIALTPLQLRLLTSLVQHRGQVLSPGQLLSLAWNDELVPRERVKLYVGYLRRRFREHGVELPVETVRGFGYRYKAPES